MIYVPVTETIQMTKTIENDGLDASPNFQRFKYNNVHRNNFSLACKINNPLKPASNKRSVVFGSSQERKRTSKLTLPSIQYDLNFKSVDRHQASPKIRVQRTKRFKSEKSDQQGYPSPIVKNTQTIVQNLKATEQHYLEKLIQRVKTPRIQNKPKISLKQDDYIPMNSQELKQSLFSLMNKYGIKKK
ncbi:unnamed protein product [Paramecium sonneborni]|uniref:Uncharacterized protein n=1 Tax=Paramecium sonneborni TaxID=65129 RepID=A0A8S1KB43_9CILI|nr:unnamed protein product [Paramecium sonneborni]